LTAPPKIGAPTAAVPEMAPVVDVPDDVVVLEEEPPPPPHAITQALKRATKAIRRLRENDFILTPVILVLFKAIKYTIKKIILIYINSFHRNPMMQSNN
jgi:hypothetical protein